MGIGALLIGLFILFWIRTFSPPPVQQTRNRFSPASGFLLQRARWTIQAWVRSIFFPRWANRYRETVCAMIGIVFFADGKTTEDEIAVLKEILARHFQSSDPQLLSRVIRQMVIARFDGTGIETYARRLKALVDSDPVMLETAVLLLLSVAASEGRVSPRERSLIEAVCRVFNIPLSELTFLVEESGAEFSSTGTKAESWADQREEQRRQENRREHEQKRAEQEQQNRGQGSRGSSAASGAAAPHDDYAILNIPRNASAAEVKKAFRALALKYHPDRLRAQGIPPQMAERNLKKFREIKDAYERIIEGEG